MPHGGGSPPPLFIAAMALTGGCGAIRPLLVPSPQPNYLLARLCARRYAARPRARRATAPTLIVSPPQAAAGFDSQRMIYLRHAAQPEYFAHNEWIDTPARMLAPLIVGALANSGAFRAVVQTPSPAAGELRLDTEILRLQQEFMAAPVRCASRCAPFWSRVRRAA